MMVVCEYCAGGGDKRLRNNTSTREAELAGSMEIFRLGMGMVYDYEPPARGMPLFRRNLNDFREHQAAKYKPHRGDCQAPTAQNLPGYRTSRASPAHLDLPNAPTTGNRYCT